jgi:hypothetical protein
MEPVTRRSFLVKGSAGAAGAAAAFGAGWTLSSAEDGEASASQSELKDLKGPLVAQVTNAKAGEVSVLVGEREVKVTDKALVAKLLRASKKS